MATTLHEDGEEVQRCSLLSLPAELRNIIYAQALIDPKQVFLKELSHDSQYQTVEPAILMIHSEIRAEALPIFYGTRIFTSQAVCELNIAMKTREDWLVQLGPERAAMLTRLRYTLSDPRPGNRRHGFNYDLDSSRLAAILGLCGKYPRDKMHTLSTEIHGRGRYCWRRMTMISRFDFLGDDAVWMLQWHEGLTEPRQWEERPRHCTWSDVPAFETWFRRLGREHVRPYSS